MNHITEGDLYKGYAQIDQHGYPVTSLSRFDYQRGISAAWDALHAEAHRLQTERAKVHEAKLAAISADDTKAEAALSSQYDVLCARIDGLLAAARVVVEAGQVTS